MKKTVIALSLIALFVIGAVAYAETATWTIKPGYNMIAVPLAPQSPLPNGVFPGILWGSNVLSKWVEPGSYQTYSNPTAANYGGMLLGQGHWLRNKTTGNETFTYTGLPNGLPDSTGALTDMWISLPINGYNMVGCPFKTNPPDTSTTVARIPLTNIVFTDGTQIKTWAQAVSAQWIAGGSYWEGGYKNLGTGPGMTNYLEGYRGYWIKTKVAPLAMIISAP